MLQAYYSPHLVALHHSGRERWRGVRSMSARSRSGLRESVAPRRKAIGDYQGVMILNAMLILLASDALLKCNH